MTAGLSPTWPLIGHASSIERLRQMALNARLPTALLFTGPARTGRRTTAIEFARVLLCPDVADGLACAECSSCRRIMSRNHPDLDLWDLRRQEDVKGASKSGALTIETVRQIAVSATHRPHESRHRIVIIDDAETLGEDAQQALLKTLEDAPGYVSIILITTSVEAIVDTVRSRTVEVPFQLVSTSEISAGLSRIRANEDAEGIAQLAQGRVGWAVAALDNPKTVDAERVANEEIERWITASARDRLVEAYRRGDALVARRVNGQQVQRSLDQVTLIWRDLLLASTGNDRLAFDSQRARRIDQSSQLTPANAYQALAACRQCQFDLSHNVRPKLALEIMVNQWPILS